MTPSVRIITEYTTNFSKAVGLTSDARYIYVADSCRQVIAKFMLNGLYVSHMNNTDPYLLAVTNDQLYAASSSNFYSFSLSLQLQKQISGCDHGSSPCMVLLRGIFIDKYKNLVYVTDKTINVIFVYQKFTLVNKIFIEIVNSHIYSIATYDEMIYIGTTTNTIIMYKNNKLVGNIINVCDVSTTIYGMYVDDYGNLLVSCNDDKQIQLYNAKDGSNTGKSILTPEKPYRLNVDISGKILASFDGGFMMISSLDYM